MPLTRRHFLARAAEAGAGAVVLTGCALFRRPAARPAPSPSPRTPDPLAPLLVAEGDVLVAYDAALLLHPQLLSRLAAIRADHAAHLAALAALVGDAGPTGRIIPSTPTPAPPAPAPASSAAGALAALASVERAAAARAGAACLVAPTTRAALLGSIAASEWAHLVLLHT